jgi:hypothetical protein
MGAVSGGGWARREAEAAAARRGRGAVRGGERTRRALLVCFYRVALARVQDDQAQEARRRSIPAAVAAVLAKAFGGKRAAGRARR